MLFIQEVFNNHLVRCLIFPSKLKKSLELEKKY
jgi:hypothetical protein